MAHRKTENTAALLGGALLGAAAMYLMDPDQGRKRRAVIKSQAGDYLDSAGEVLQSGFEKVSEGARGVGQTVAEKAEVYGQRLSDLAKDYSERLTEHAGDVDSWSARAKGAASQLTDSVEGLRNQGRKWWGKYTGKAQDYADDASHAASDVTDYGNQLWGQVRDLGKKLHGRADDAVKRARSYTQEEHSSAAVPVAVTAIGCCAMGVGLMYLMDPKQGQARRSWLMDKMASTVRQTGSSFYRTGKDLANRAKGVAHETGSRISSGGPVASETLLARVRSEMGHWAFDTSQVHVIADANGTVTLTGSVPAAESGKLIAAIEAMPGVNVVINRLDIVEKEAGKREAGHNSPKHSTTNM
jgi:gas vesicle protein